MICPGCNEELAADPKPRRCPSCGTGLWSTVSGVVRTSAVLISEGGEDFFFESVGEVPAPMRRRIVSSTRGENAGTIIIADRAGRERIAAAVRRRNARRSVVATAIEDVTTQPVAAADVVPLAVEPVREGLPEEPRRAPWLAWAGLGLVLAGAAAFLYVFTR